MKLSQNQPVIFACVGVILGLGAPLGLWALNGFYQQSIPYSLHYIYWYCGITTCVVFAGFGYTLGLFIRQIERQSFFDGLTGLYNRRLMNLRLEEAIAENTRYENGLSLIMFDLDHGERLPVPASLSAPVASI